jgi:hypothetical protein
MLPSLFKHPPQYFTFACAQVLALEQRDESHLNRAVAERCALKLMCHKNAMGRPPNRPLSLQCAASVERERNRGEHHGDAFRQDRNSEPTGILGRMLSKWLLA